MPCPVCQYNHVREVDRALLTGVSPQSLSQKFSFSVPVLERHKKHLVEKMAVAEKRFHSSIDQWLFCKLNLVMEMVLAVVRGAKTGGDFKLFLQANREFTRIITLMHKISVRLDPECLYCLMALPEWELQEESLLPAAFQALSQTRQSLKVNLYAPCPEPEPEVAPSPPGESRPPAPTTAMPLASRQPQTTETPARQKRDKTAKIHPKIHDNAINNKLNQCDMQCEKNVPPKTATLWQKLWQGGKKAGN